MTTTTGDVNFYLIDFKEQAYETPFNAGFQAADTYITANNAIRATLNSINGFIVGNGSGGFTAKNLSALNGFISCNGSGTFTATNLGALTGFIESNGSGSFTAHNLGSLNGVIESNGSGAFSAKKKYSAKYGPSSVFNLTDSYVAIPGSSVSFTPNSIVSSIHYQFSFHLAGLNSTGLGAAHFRLYVGGSPVETGWTVSMLNNAEGRVVADVTTDSWSGAKTMALYVRRYSSAASCKIHETNYYNGAVSSSLVTASLKVEEV